MWATSIGSTFSQIPSPGLRKSGIPLGTEIPAPVSATVHSDSRMSPASRSAWAAVVGAGGMLEDVKTVPVSERMPPATAAAVPKSPSFALPLRAALLEEGGDALPAVLGEERGCEALLLGLDPL